MKPGLRDAGIAAKNMELVATLGKPEGFFDPKAPAGDDDSGRAAREAIGGAEASSRHRHLRRRIRDPAARQLPRRAGGCRRPAAVVAAAA